jgi:hypothetical protein
MLALIVHTSTIVAKSFHCVEILVHLDEWIVGTGAGGWRNHGLFLGFTFKLLLLGLHLKHIVLDETSDISQGFDLI